MRHKVINYTDEELISILKNNHVDTEVVKYLYRNYFKILSLYVQQNSGTIQDAEDIFQEVIVAFINLIKEGKFRGEASIKTFLFSLNRFTWLNELKKRNRALLREIKFDNTLEHETKDITHVIENREAMLQVMQMFDALGNICKKILIAFYYDNHSMKEILNLVDFQNEQVLRNKKHKCLKSLADMLTANPLLAKQFKNALSHGQ